jgi:hypothetical protein
MCLEKTMIKKAPWFCFYRKYRKVWLGDARRLLRAEGFDLSV